MGRPEPPETHDLGNAHVGHAVGGWNLELGRPTRAVTPAESDPDEEQSAEDDPGDQQPPEEALPARAYLH
jgi:hypothetical protein